MGKEMMEKVGLRILGVPQPGPLMTEVSVGELEA